MDISQIIIKPFKTEKSYALKNNAIPKYGFIVNKKATKYDIAIAFETIYGQHPIKITTQIKKSVSTKTGTMHPGFTKEIKVAYVSLPAGANLDPNSKQEPTDKNVNVKPINKNVAKKEVTKKSTTNTTQINVQAVKKEIKPEEKKPVVASSALPTNPQEHSEYGKH